jgi:cell division protein FtsL
VAAAVTRRGGRAARPLRGLGWLLILLGSFALVPWRQTRGVALEREVLEVQNRHAVVEAERIELLRRIHSLESRARVLRVARDRLGMHLPTGREIVFLPLPAGGLRGGGAAP